jgi:hypothetical protein
MIPDRDAIIGSGLLGGGARQPVVEHEVGFACDLQLVAVLGNRLDRLDSLGVVKVSVQTTLRIDARQGM